MVGRGPICLALLAFALPQATAQDKFDPAARAKVIAPLVDEYTVAVLHVDLSRMPADALFAKALEILPELQDRLAEPRRGITAALTELEPVAGKELYVVLSLADVGPAAPNAPLIALPLKPGADEKALAKVLDSPHVAKKRVGSLLVISAPQTVKRLEGLKPEPRPEIAAAFEAAGDTGGQVLLFVPSYARRVIEELMPELPKEVGGGPSTLVTHGVRWIAIGADVAPQLSGRLVIQSQDAQAAQALRDRWVEILKLAGQQKEIRQFVPQFDLLAAILTPKVEGSHMSITLDADPVGKVLHLLQGPIAAARESAQRRQSMNQLRQIGLAVWNHYDEHKTYPPRATYSPDGKPLLSWRVLILPQMAQQALYKQFHLNEPWDSPHNRTLISKMPAVYRSPFSKSKDPGKTNYVLPVGPGTVFGGKEPLKITGITNGTSNVIMSVEVDDQHAVVWTKPDDLPYDPKEPLRGLGGLVKSGFLAVYCDCSVHFLQMTIEPKALRALFSAAAADKP